MWDEGVRSCTWVGSSHWIGNAEVPCSFGVVLELALSLGGCGRLECLDDNES